MATYDNAQLIKMCGPPDPYPGEIGVVRAGALADPLLVDGKVDLAIAVEIMPIEHGIRNRLDGSGRFGLTFTRSNKTLSQT